MVGTKAVQLLDKDIKSRFIKNNFESTEYTKRVWEVLYC